MFSCLHLKQNQTKRNSSNNFQQKHKQRTTKQQKLPNQTNKNNSANVLLFVFPKVAHWLVLFLLWLLALLLLLSLPLLFPDVSISRGSQCSTSATAINNNSNSNTYNKKTHNNIQIVQRQYDSNNDSSDCSIYRITQQQYIITYSRKIIMTTIYHNIFTKYNNINHV